MKRPLRILLLSTSATEAEALARGLQRGHEGLLVERVGDLDTFARMLAKGGWDCLLADFDLPDQTGTEALSIARRGEADVPFLYLTRELNEATATAALRDGARDIFAKDDLARLPAVLERELRDASHRHAVQRAMFDLRESEELNRSLVDHLGFGVFRCTARSPGLFLKINPALARLLGYASASLPMRTSVASHFVDPSDWLRILADLTQGGTICRRTLRFRRGDGKYAWLAFTASASVEPGGSLLWVDGMLEDYNERVAAEGRARILEMAVEQSPASIVITNPRGEIEYVNPKFSEVTGYTLAEVIGQNPRVLKSGAMAPEVYRQLWETITRGLAWRGELENRRKDGSVFWESAVISAIRNDAGEVEHFLAVKEDITARREAALKIARDEAFYQVLVQSLPQSIILKDARGRFLFANQSFCRLMGRSREEILGKTDFDLYPVALATKYRLDDERVMASGKILDLTEEGVSAAGHVCRMRVIKVPVQDATGRPLGTECIFWDIDTFGHPEESSPDVLESESETATTVVSVALQNREPQSTP